jgi:hypothetical protein
MIEMMPTKIEWVVKYGYEEAGMLWWIVHWVEQNKANEINFYDGKTWTYNSKKAWAELFFWWSEKQIRRLLDNLIERGAIITGCYNKQPFDRTLWYALSDIFEADRSAQTGQCDQPKRANVISPNGPTNTIKENHKEEKKEIDVILFDAAKSDAEKHCEPNKQHFASPEVVQVFDHWNNVSPLKHRKINDAMEKAISIRLKENSIDDLKACISNYASVVTNAASWYTYQSSLDDFFRVGKLKPAPCMKFFPERFVLQNFLDKKKRHQVPAGGSRIIKDDSTPRSRII